MRPLVAFLVATAIYAASAAPTLLWGDDAELQRIAITGEVRAVGQSSAASHLLWQAVASAFVRWTGWLPIDPAGRVTLVSAIAAAMALVPLAAAIGALGRRAGLGRQATAVATVVGTVAFGLGHTFWLLASRPDAYTIQTLLLATATWACLGVRPGWRGVARAAIAAVAVAAALANHLMILASVPGLAVLATARLHVATRTVAIGVAAVGGLGGTAIAVGVLAGFPVGAVLSAVMSYQPHLPPVRDALLVPAYLAYQFPASLALAAWARAPLSRLGWRVAAGLGLMYLGVAGLMLFRHHPGMVVRDQYLFYLPSYLPVAIVVGLGAGWLVETPPVWSRLRGRAFAATLVAIAAAPVVAYPLAATVAGPVATRLAPARTLPGRDPVRYYLWPPKAGYTGARDYATAAFEVLPPGAVVLADWLPYQPLRYVQAVEGARPDVRLEMINAGEGRQLAFLKAQAPGTPLYLADASPPPYYEIDDIRACFDVTPVGATFKLTRKTICG